MGKDYISANDAEFDIFQDNFMEKVEPKLADWEIPVAEFTALQVLQTAWNDAWALAKDKDTRSRGDVRAKEVARKAYEAGLRRFVKSRIAFNNKLTDADIESLGLKVRDIEPTPRPEITTAPIVGLKGLESGRIEVRCRARTDQTRPSMLKAANAIAGNYILVERGDIAPENPEKCPEKIVISRAKFVMDAGPENAGKQFYGFFRWMNTSRREKSGPWSKVHTVIVP